MMPALVQATWLLPAIVVAVLMLMRNNNSIRYLSLAATVVNLGIVLVLLVAYLGDPGHAGHATAVGGQSDGITRLAFASRVEWFPHLNLQFYTGVDGISLLMMTMASLIAVCGVLVSWNIEERCKEFFILLFVLLSGTYGCFISFDLLSFFLFNEVTLIPTYLLIGLYGSGRKEYAAMKLNLMLFGGSALIILGICGLWYVGGHFDIIALSQSDAIRQDTGFQAWAFPVLFLGFGILGSLFPFHTWSPAGHASAPTAISMFLAGVHMKLGGYGCLRVAMYLLPEGAQQWMPVFLVLATISVVYGALIAIRRTDLKFINAYASISHVGMVTFGFAMLSAVGIKGGVLQMLSHGFVTALVFALIGAIYSRTHTRQVDEMGGLMKSVPILSVAFVIAGFAVVGMPGTSSFIAEVTIFISGFAGAGTLTQVCAVACVASIVITAVYVLRTVNSVVHGPAPKAKTYEFADARWNEKVVIGILAGSIFAFGLLPSWIVDVVDASAAPIVHNLERSLPAVPTEALSTGTGE